VLAGRAAVDQGTSHRLQLLALLNGETRDAGTVPPDLVELAYRERVHLLLAERLGVRRPGQSRDAVADRLATAVRLAAIEEARRSAELVRVVARLESAGCAPVVLKGAALAHTHYRSPWLRPRVDTDVLVAPDSRGAAARVFADLNYMRHASVDGALVTYQETFVRSERDGFEHVFDVHWRVSNAQVVSRVLSHEELRAQAVAVRVHALPVGTAPVDSMLFQVPCPVHALLLACVHRAAHHQDSLDVLWLYDIHLLASRFTADEWQAWRDLVVDRGVAVICARGVQLACTAFHTPLPDSMADAWPAGAAQREASAVFLRPDISRAARLWADLRALSFGDRVRLLVEVVLPPVAYMRATGGDRAWLPWLYLRRVLRGVGKWFRPIRPA
jgi:hypothetical protein